jgi:hypothetical protein
MRGGGSTARLATWLAALGIATIALTTVLLATRQGPGSTVDSGEYVAVADGLRHGHGLTMPYVGYDEPYPEVVTPGERVDLTVFPPLFPATIAATSLASGAAPITSARWVNALSYALMAAIVVALVAGATRSVAAGALAGALTIAPTFVYTASMVWSEPMMLAGYVATIAALRSYLRTRATSRLVTAIALAALTSMVRFTGLAAVLAVAVVLLVADDDDVARRCRRAIVGAACGALPEVLWFARSTFVIGAPSEKPLAWHPPGRADLQRTARTVTSWFVRDTPDRRMVIGVLVALLVLVAIVSAVRRARSRPVDMTSLPSVCAVFAIVYAAFELAARATFDNNIDLSTRQLLALQVVAIMGVVSVAWTWRPRRRIVAVGVAAVVLVIGAVRLVTATVPDLPDTDHSGYSSAAWDRSAGLDLIRSLPLDALVVTNAPDAVWLRTGRTPLFLPLTANLYRGSANDRYGAELTALARAIRGRNAVVVFFDRPTRGHRRVIDDAALHVLQLDGGHRLADATRYDPG